VYRAGKGPRQDIKRIERTYRHAHRWRGQFLYEPPLYILLASLSRSLSFSSSYLSTLSISLRKHPSSSSFSRGVEEFFELTPTCFTTVRFVLFRTKDSKWRLVRRSFFSLLQGLSTLSHLLCVCVCVCVYTS